MRHKDDLVPVAPLRDAFNSSDLSMADLARRLGWVRGPAGGDTTRVARALGLRAASGYTNTQINYDTAVLVCRAIGATPREVGL